MVPQIVDQVKWQLMSVKMFILSEQIRYLENSIQVRSIRSDNLSAQTSTDMPLGGQELRRSGMEEGEASKAVNSSVISASPLCHPDNDGIRHVNPS